MATSIDRRAALALLMLGPLLGISGCGGPPQVAQYNRRTVLALATATSARNPDWLEQCSQEVEKSRAEGRLSEAESATFGSILAKARAGDWEAAREEAYALRDAQEPTAESVEAVRKRVLPTPIKPESPRGGRKVVGS